MAKLTVTFEVENEEVADELLSELQEDIGSYMSSSIVAGRASEDDPWT